MTIYTRNKEGVLTPLKLPVIKGKDGKDGKNGVTPNITLGEVNTLESGEEANVIIKGDKENPILDFNLPKGEEGLNIALSSDKIDRKLKRIDSKVKEIETKNEEQEERIKEVEDKEKKQNFYINGLFNENEDNRVSIEEEGNDIKLESSRKGFVEVDKIVGNTLVNRVSEPMRELTLNGDIDTEGTFVSTTETVENGLVDIVCEGNTIVNVIDWRKFTSLVDNKWVVNKTNPSDIIYNVLNKPNVNLLKPSTQYTVIAFIEKNTLNGAFRLLHSYNSLMFIVRGIEINKGVTGIVKRTFSTVSDFSTSNRLEMNIPINVTGELIVSYMCILEGDYTDKPTPNEYFEGMKSVGEQVDGNHKIEVLSKNANENLFKKVKRFYDSGMNNVIYDKENCAFTIDSPQAQKNIRFEEVISKDGIYTLSFKARSNSLCRLSIDLVDKGVTIIEIDDIEKEYVITFDTDGIVAYNPKTYHFIDFVVLETTNNRIEITEVKLEEGSIKTPFTQTSNKKEILLNEPLRGLPNGVKDRFVKKDGKWFIERNCQEIILDENINYSNSIHLYDNTYRFGVNTQKYKLMKGGYGISDTIPYLKDNSDDIEHLRVDGTVPYGNIIIWMSKDKITNSDNKTIQEYFKNNPCKIIAELTTPIYEPLEIAPELICYDELTHISNDSLIPCNMVVKNTGFSCRALTSGSTYTAVHNGGEGITSKVDTIDNTVRLSGKGKKVSDVTVVDGNVSKLHYTFKGMKSTFEDKLVTQEMVDNGLEKAENLGKYKVGVTVRGKNIMDFTALKTNTVTLNGVTITFDTAKNYFIVNGTATKDTYLYATDSNLPYKEYPFETSKTYSIIPLIEGTHTGELYVSLHGNTIATRITNGVPNRIGDGIFNGTYNQAWLRLTNGSSYVNCKIYIGILEGTVATQYEPYFEQSQTVYLNSPFHKGDEICVHGGQLGYWKNRFRKVFDGDTQVTRSANSDQKALTSHFMIASNSYNSYIPNTDKNVICDMFATKLNLGALVNVEDECITNSGGQLWININRSKLSSDTVAGFKVWLKTNPITIEYMLKTPIFVPILENTPKWVLEIPYNATLHIDSTIPCQNTKVNYTSKIPNLLTMEDDISNINKCSIDMIANNFDMDYRLLEVEWALEDIGINLVDTRRINNTGLSRFHQAKLLITSGEYDKEKLTCQLSEYLERRYLDQEEFNELIDLMD